MQWLAGRALAALGLERGPRRNAFHRIAPPPPPRPVRTLDPRALDEVRGGVSRLIISPRDPQSGLPTGK